MRHAGQDEEQSELGETVVAERGGQAQGIGDLLEDKQEGKDGSIGGSGGVDVIEFATEQTAQGLDAFGGPGGEVGEGAVFDFAVLTEGLAEEDGGRGGAVGYGGYIHADSIRPLHL